jgi:hypothetical protein
VRLLSHFYCGSFATWLSQHEVKPCALRPGSGSFQSTTGSARLLDADRIFRDVRLSPSDYAQSTIQGAITIQPNPCRDHLAATKSTIAVEPSLILKRYLSGRISLSSRNPFGRRNQGSVSRRPAMRRLPVVPVCRRATLLLISANQKHILCRPVLIRGAARDRHGRGVRDAMDALAPRAGSSRADERHRCGRRNRVVLASRR